MKGNAQHDGELRFHVDGLHYLSPILRHSGRFQRKSAINIEVMFVSTCALLYMF